MRAWATSGSGLFPELKTVKRVVLFPTFPHNKDYFIFKCPNPHVFTEVIFGSYFEIISSLSIFFCHLTIIFFGICKTLCNSCMDVNRDRCRFHGDNLHLSLLTSIHEILG